MTPSKSPVRLLHFEDNRRAAELMWEKIEAGQMSCEVVLVDTQEGFESAVSRQEFDLVLCDYNVPSYSGAAALKQVQRKQPQTPVIFISGAVGDDPSARCRRQGAAEYVLKYRLEKLVPAMKRALRESSMQRKVRAISTASRRPQRMHAAHAACVAAA